MGRSTIEIFAASCSEYAMGPSLEHTCPKSEPKCGRRRKAGAHKLPMQLQQRGRREEGHHPYTQPWRHHSSPHPRPHTWTAKKRDWSQPNRPPPLGRKGRREEGHRPSPQPRRHSWTAIKQESRSQTGPVAAKQALSQPNRLPATAFRQLHRPRKHRRAIRKTLCDLGTAGAGGFHGFMLNLSISQAICGSCFSHLWT